MKTENTTERANGGTPLAEPTGSDVFFQIEDWYLADDGTLSLKLVGGPTICIGAVHFRKGYRGGMSVEFRIPNTERQARYPVA